MRTTATSTRWRRLAPLIAVPVLAFLTLVSWGFASPVGASPDDDFHLASIWCGGASLTDSCDAGAASDQREVPRDLTVDAVCYAYEDEESAACQGADFGSQPDDKTSTSRGNFDGTYPPLFYSAMSVFAGPDIQVSVLAMRIVNSALAVGLLAALWVAIPTTLRRSVLVPVLVTVVPLGLFLIPSTNPSSWAILSAALLWPSLVGYFRAAGRRRVALGAVATIAALMGAGSRADAAVYVGVGAVLAVVLTFERSRRYLFLSILPIVLVLTAVLFYLSAGQGAVTSTGFDDVVREGHSVPTLLIANLALMPELWAGFFGFGNWGLGWLDTAMPPIVWVSSLALLIIAIFQGLRWSYPRKSLAMIIAFASFILIPSLVLLQSGVMVGAYLQPRYILPLAIILVGIAVLRQRPGDRDLSRLQRIVLIAMLAGSNAIALEFNIRRYVTGTDITSVDLDAGREWWWPDLAVSPNAVWVIGSLTFAAMLVLIDRVLSVSRERSELEVD